MLIMEFLFGDNYIPWNSQNLSLVVSRFPGVIKYSSSVFCWQVFFVEGNFFIKQDIEQYQLPHQSLTI